MKKTDAITKLGGTYRSAADAIGCTRQAIQDWPDELPRRIEDRVLAALYRRSQDAPAPTEQAADASA